ncbi:putative ribonuclease H-like domain-containing protein [Tanacetum coccineum]
MVPRTVLTRSGPISVNTVRPVNTVQSRTTVNNAGPMKNVINNAYSTARRPFNKITAANNSNFTKKVNTVKGTMVNTARPKTVISAVKGNKGNDVKASACWVWRPKHKILDHGNPQQDLKNKGVIDSGCSRHMTGNKSYLTYYEEIDGGFVAFRDFKLTDESHVLLRVPRKDNMYSVDLKNVFPQGGLTCLFAKATPDESNLWHRRSDMLNFKTMKKLEGNNTQASCRKPALSFMRPFGCPVIILNTIDHLGTALTNSMNYKPVVARNQSNGEEEMKDAVVPGYESGYTMKRKDNDDENVGAEADMNNLDAFRAWSVFSKYKIHKDHTIDQIIGDLNSVPQTRRMTKNLKEHGVMQDELLQFKLQKVWTVVDLPNGKRAIGYTQEEGIDYDKVFAPVAKIEAIMLFLAYALSKDFVVYQIDVKSAFLYGKIEEEVYVCQPPGFEDPDFPDIVYKVEQALYGLHQAPRAWCLQKKEVMHRGMQVRMRRKMGILYKPDRFQVNPKVSHLHAMKRIFRYLKGQPKLGLWYHKDSPFDLVAYTDSDYAEASLDRKSTIGAALSCCGQVLWIQNQLLDYRDSNEKKLIQMIKIHTDKNVADLLTKAFDVSRFQYLIASIRMLNL